MCEKHMPIPFLKEWSKLKEKLKITNPDNPYATPEDLGKLLKESMKQLGNVDSSNKGKNEQTHPTKQQDKDHKDPKKGGGARQSPATAPGSFSSKKDQLSANQKFVGFVLNRIITQQSVPEPKAFAQNVLTKSIIS